MADIYKLTFGTPEKNVPSRFKSKTDINLAEACRYPVHKIVFKTSPRGCSLELPLDGEEIFGFGIQFKSVCHRGTKKIIRSNADPLSDSGDSHAPVPFFITNKGYGVLVDTARYVSFYCGVSHVHDHITEERSNISETEKELYAAKKNEQSVMLIDVPVAKGVDIYLFEGDNISDIVSTYNMYSGGGCMPALWGLGVLYRCHTKSDSKGVLKFAEYFRENHIPCDIIGLEPGWQSHAYSCTLSWDNDRFPDWNSMIENLTESKFHVNLWEHAYVNTKAPIYNEMKEYSGNYEVWEGLVPDFADENAVRIFSDYHRNVLVKQGVSGFKLDECDGSDFTGGWAFPNSSVFPSGLDGEQMHNMFGILYQKTMLKSLGNLRTFSEVRNSGAFAAPYPFVLYSDLYGHRDYIRGLVNSGYSGILWAPEIRGAKNKNDLIRRLQTAVFSCQTVLNQWNQPIAPWLKWDAVEEAKTLLEIRMSLIPYLYSAFYGYHINGQPPVRSLAFDFEDEIRCYTIDDEYMFGNSMLVAPMTEDQDEREVYLPTGKWYDFWTGKAYEGGITIVIKSDNIPVFVKDNSVIPWASPTEYIDEKTCFDITLKCFGKNGVALLVEDDGVNNDTEYKVYHIRNSDGKIIQDLDQSNRYSLVKVEYVS